MEEKLLDILEDLCGDNIVHTNRDVELYESGLLDSVSVVELLVALEEEFDLVISPSDIPREDFNTPNKIIAQVKKRLEK